MLFSATVFKNIDTVYFQNDNWYTFNITIIITQFQSCGSLVQLCALLMGRLQSKLKEIK